MFEELILMAAFLIFSVIISYILLKYTPSPLDKLVLGLAIIGIVIHEICHVLMCLITNAPVKRVKLLEKTKLFDKEGENYEYGGNIEIKSEKKLTFLQAVLIGFAPLIFSFWIFLFLLDFLITAELETYIAILILFIMISIVLAAAPSAVDILNIPAAFQNNPKYSCYQIFLLLISIISVWFLSIFYQITFVHELVNYILIMMFYYGIKYVFKGINEIINPIFSRRTVQKYSEGIKKSRIYNIYED